jgi:anti-sigma-K factor RskA
MFGIGVMAYSDDHIALAAEYALGTLDANERALVETMMIVDPGFLEMVEAWDRKLTPLHQMVAPVEPPADLWDKIKVAAGLSEGQSPIVLPEVHADRPTFEHAAVHEPRSYVGAPEPVIEDRPVPVEAEDEPVVKSESARPARSSQASRIYGTLMTAVAAGLAAIIVLQIRKPELLPEALRVKPKVQLVEVKAPAPQLPAQLVAVLQSGASEPAFILTVDTLSRTYTVRRVGAPPQHDKSYELWIVSAKLGAPRSLGIIGTQDFTSRSVLTSYDADIVNNATYAVTVEPQGGSPTGAPTSQPLWAGKLFESTLPGPSKP